VDSAKLTEKKDSTKKSLLEIMLVTIPKLVNGLSTFVLNTILLAVFEPATFGVFSLCMYGILLADAVLGSALDFGVLRLSPLYLKEDHQYALIIEKAALLVKVQAFAVIGTVLLAVSLFFFHYSETTFLILLSTLAAFGMLLLRSIQVHLQVRRKFILYGSLDLLLIFLRYGGIVLILLFFSPSPLKILLCYAISPFIIFSLGVFYLGREFFSRKHRFKEGRAELLKYILWFLATFSLGALLSRLDIFLIGLLKGQNEAGIFSGGLNFALIPELLGTYLAVVFGPRIMPAYQNGSFYPFFKKTQLSLLLLALVGFLAAWAFAVFIWPHIFSNSYNRSSSIFLLLLPGTLANMLIFPLMVSFLMFVRPHFWISMELITLPILIICYIFSINAWGAQGAALVSMASRIIKSTIGHIFASKWAKQPYTIKA
jgi:O-antigen/teichoic acid export membrane protein